jgi:hypothetical protein
MASLLSIAWIYLRIGCMFVGGGYVLIPLLNQIMVEQYRWLTLKEFLDGVALSQLTPGPLAMLATFTGFRIGGFMGGLVATVAIFIPCTVLMLLVGTGRSAPRGSRADRCSRVESGGGLAFRSPRNHYSCNRVCDLQMDQNKPDDCHSRGRPGGAADKLNIAKIVTKKSSSLRVVA